MVIYIYTYIKYVLIIFKNAIINREQWRDKNSKNVAQEKIIQICQNINSELIVPGSLTVNKNTVSFEVSQNATERSVREMCSNIARATDLTTHISSIDLLKAMDQRNK